MGADVRIASVGMTRFGKLPGDAVDLAEQAAFQALDDQGRAEPDRLVVASMAPEAFTGQGNLAVAVADRLELEGVPAVRVETGPSSGGAALHEGWLAIAAGRAERVLVVGTEKMTSLPRARATDVVAALTSPEERAAGFTMPTLCAALARAGMAAGRWSRADLSAPSVHAHRWAQHNPRAHLPRPVREEDVPASPVVADPLHVLDCAPMSDGAAAVLLERAHGPVRVAGLGHATDRLGLAPRGLEGLEGFKASRLAAQRALAHAGWRIGGVDYAEVHDAFTPVALCSVEDLGLCGKGEGPALWREEAGVPVNRGGGLKARGHPVGATGVAQAVEAWEQLTGAVTGPRRVDARKALLHNIGGLGNNVLVTLLEAV